MQLFKRKERTEEILIKATFKSSQLNKANKRILEEYVGKSLEDVYYLLQEEDTFSTEFRLCIDYYNGIVDKLKLFLILLDTPDIITSMSTKEIRYGKSLLLEVASKLEEVENKLKNK